MNSSLEELASLYVLDQMDVAERAAFEARLPREPELAALVRELESALAARLNALPSVDPPARVLARIEARIDAASSTKAVADPVLKDGPRGARHRGLHSSRVFALQWAVIGGVAALLLAGLGFALFTRFRAPRSGDIPVVIVATLDGSRSRLTELPLRNPAGNSDARFIQLASLAERFWDRPDALPLKPIAADGHGYAVFDPTTNQGFIAVQHVPALEAGQRYHLWVVDTASREVRDAGMLPLTGGSGGLFSFSVGAAGERRGGPVNFFITVEDTSQEGAVAPRGRVVLGRNPI